MPSVVSKHCPGIEIGDIVRISVVSMPGQFPDQNALASKSATSFEAPLFRSQVVFLHQHQDAPLSKSFGAIRMQGVAHPIDVAGRG